MANPAVAATLVWILPSNGDVIFRQVSCVRFIERSLSNKISSFTQVRINGRIEELSGPEIAELYKGYPLHAKIRSKICAAGEPVDWNVLKEEHDRVLEANQAGSEPLEQNEHL